MDLAIALEGFFFEKVNRSTGQRVKRVNGSNGLTGQRVTFTFTILYMTADNARLTPPRCKKHTAYDDTRLTPHHCKTHTPSFARSTGKFPSKTNSHKIASLCAWHEDIYCYLCKQCSIKHTPQSWTSSETKEGESMHTAASYLHGTYITCR